MALLQGLNGTVALILICCLLFVDEAGLPLPIAPNEGLLLLAGVLVSSDAFPLWLMFPVAFFAMTCGMLIGYGWARTIGQSGLQALAERVRAVDAYDRARSRLGSSGPWGIGLARLIPGLRPYATLVSGAAEVDPRTFLLGALPALLVWEIFWVAAGVLVGLPLVHLLGRFEKVILRAGILIGLGLVAWFAVAHTPADGRSGIVGMKPRLRACVALLVDAAIVASVVGGSFAIGRRVLQVSTNGWIEPLVTAVLLMGLLLYGRARQTPGETLFDTHYWHHASARAPQT